MSTDQPSTPVAHIRGVTSPQQMRTRNLRLLLDVFWSRPTEVLTSADLMGPTGLTRTTVLEICRDLERRRWIMPAQPARATLGRQALGFAFNHARKHVVGADVGHRSVRAVVADLSGTIVGRAQRSYANEDWDSPRGADLGETINQALEAAGVPAEGVAAACVGVAAPVDADGRPPESNRLWDSVRVTADDFLTDQRSWRVRIENDANLAALAERDSGDLPPGETFITLLSGERLGSGIIIGGQLHRGDHGTAGEVDYLRRVTGVNDLTGIGRRAGTIAASGLREGRSSTLTSAWDGKGDVVPAELVFQAAQAGDEFAGEVVDELGESFAIAISTMSSFVDPSAVVLAGGITPSSQPVVDSINAHIQAILPTPPAVVASTLGRDGVLIGAVHEAIDAVRAQALED
ncbi:ROK family protein [Brachybacterium hainanense]|uniref:ROK family protein n=1 Tax=Brachybacterium hainanense TaxID=1541174 RepID=A0ABV6RDU9_9MICO